MLIKELTDCLEAFAPLPYQESYDNSGLITGNKKQEVTGALLCLDSTEAVLDEAIALGCNLVIAHHPIVFSGLKKINGNNYVERVIIKAIQHNIAIYAIHTNLDNVIQGVNAKIAQKLGLRNLKILAPKKGLLKKLVTYVPAAEAEKVRNALFAAGCGNIGNYDSCSFNLKGDGTFRGNELSQPHVGEKGKLHTENETRIETVFSSPSEGRVLQALFGSHPYEEVAYDIYSLDNTYSQVGSGVMGELEVEKTENDFLSGLKSILQVPCIRHTSLRGKKVKKVALCGGSGSFLLKNAMAAGADVYVSADFKYHEFFDAENKVVIADVGHYESEQFTNEIFYEVIRKKFPTFALHLSKINTNPINYF